MSLERTIKMVMADLSSELLKLEDDLETALNSTSSADGKVQTIKHILSQMVMKEAAMAKFTKFAANNIELK